jgi:hypothetical protein
MLHLLPPLQPLRLPLRLREGLEGEAHNQALLVPEGSQPEVEESDEAQAE